VSGYGEETQERLGFFTDTSLCIGCKACEVACKEWNDVPSDELEWKGLSYDNTVNLDADNWRHVAFVEQRLPLGVQSGIPGSLAQQAALQEVSSSAGIEGVRDAEGLRWLMASDVCKHCTHAACLDVCPTGALFRTEHDTVVVQEDVCNGCGYCVPACPFGVLDKRSDDGRVWKCTLCYDRSKDGLEPACAKACPTDSIQWGELGDLRTRAAERLAAMEAAGVAGAQLYLHGEDDGIGGAGAFFLLLDDPEVYGLPPDPVVTTRALPRMWALAGVAAAALAAGIAGAVR
jgi:formate dehydrogenase iron-sulfur subunit